MNRTLDLGLGGRATRAARPSLLLLPALVLAGVLSLSATAFAAPPEVPVTGEATAITATAATLNGGLGEPNPENVGEMGAYEFVYSQSSGGCAGPEEKRAPEPPGLALGLGRAPVSEKELVSERVTGLQPATAYTFCLLVNNIGGELAEGASVTFTTIAAVPAITSEFASSVGSTSATLHAVIDPGGAATTYHFQYGTSTAYGHSTAESVSIGSDNADHSVIAPIAALQPGTTYHYQVVASNAQSPGGTPGPDKTFTTPELPGSAPSEDCANEQLRGENRSMGLPDCRAYELVTPPDKESDEPRGVEVGLNEPRLDSLPGMHASETGNRIAWTTEYNLPGSGSPGLDDLSTRGPTGWTSENVIPPQSVENGTNCPALVAMAAYSSDLSKGVLADGYAQPGSFKGEALNCGHDEPLLVPGEPQGFQNLFLRDNDTLTYQLVDVTPPDAPAPEPLPVNKGQYFPASFLAGSSDLSHVVFEEELQLTHEAPLGDDLYEWTAGHVRLVTLLPGGEAVLGTLAGSTKNTGLEELTETFVPFNIANYRHAVSGDGSRVFFEAGGDLYVRENAEQPPLEECTASSKACTVQVDVRQGGSGLSGGGKFMIASDDGSKVFFTDESRLTSDSKAEAGKPDLYEYDLEKPGGKRLADVSADATEPANVLGVSGASEDGSYLYFVAEGVLTGTQKNSRGATAQSGRPNLYVFHEGAPTFIATLDASNDSCDWMSPACVDYPLLGGLTARVSANGPFIAFNSDQSLTDYDNTGSACVPELIGGSGGSTGGFSPGACQEVFLYDAATDTLSCASCDPSGAVPAGPAMIPFPAGASTDAEMENKYPQRNVSDNGQVFFETPDALVPGDTNGRRDVYEYEDGRPYLISSGTSAADSYFLDASVNGSDVFFVTAQPLLPRDGDAAYDIYDARVDGGFPESAGPGVSCEGKGCRGAAAAAPAFPAPSGSATLSGSGNLTASPSDGGPVKKATKKRARPCKRGYVRDRAKCVKRHKAKAKKSAKRRK
jgi:hypothetical protein